LSHKFSIKFQFLEKVVSTIDNEEEEEEEEQQQENESLQYFIHISGKNLSLFICFLIVNNNYLCKAVITYVNIITPPPQQ
jgi:hypothetical protein